MSTQFNFNKSLLLIFIVLCLSGCATRIAIITPDNNCIAHPTYNCMNKPDNVGTENHKLPNQYGW